MAAVRREGFDMAGCSVERLMKAQDGRARAREAKPGINDKFGGSRGTSAFNLAPSIN